MTGAASPVEVLTFGCRLNIVESEAMRAAALAAGEGDLAIVNTCAVTGEAARQSRQAVRRIARDRPGIRIAVTGCAAEIDPAGFAALPGVERLIANARKSAPETWPGGTGSSAAALGQAAPRHTRGFVEIQNGCDHRCTFCVIPFGRGATRSVPPDRVADRVRTLVEAGAREIVLTGVDVTSYASDGLSLGALVKRVLRAVPDLPRLRLSSIDCIEADRDLFDVIGGEPRFMPHLHLSLQSGADLILKRMKRRHGRAQALAFCRQVRALRPDIALGADMIAGFPTETEAQALETESLVEDCGVTFLHVFPYSARPGTPAARMPPVPAETIRIRAARLRDRGASALRRHLDAQVGRTLQVLTERGARGHAEDFTPVDFAPAVPAGAILTARLLGHDGKSATGAIV